MGTSGLNLWTREGKTVPTFILHAYPAETAAEGIANWPDPSSGLRRYLRRQVESSPHGLPGVWAIIFPFVRNVITCRARSSEAISRKLLKYWVYIAAAASGNSDLIGSTCALALVALCPRRHPPVLAVQS